MQSKLPEDSGSANSIAERLAAWIRGRWQLITVPTPPYTGIGSHAETPAQQAKPKR